MWLLLLSGHKSRDQEEGEGGERRASTRRPARTRHCVFVRCSVGSLRKAARAGVMEHQQEAMRVYQESENCLWQRFWLDIKHARGATAERAP